MTRKKIHPSQKSGLGGFAFYCDNKGRGEYSHSYTKSLLIYSRPAPDILREYCLTTYK